MRPLKERAREAISLLPATPRTCRRHRSDSVTLGACRLRRQRLRYSRLPRSRSCSRLSMSRSAWTSCCHPRAADRSLAPVQADGRSRTAGNRCKAASASTVLFASSSSLNSERAWRGRRLRRRDRRLREAIEKANPEEAEKQALKELARLERAPEASAEHSMIRSYLDWLIELPWSKLSDERIDIAERAGSSTRTATACPNQAAHPRISRRAQALSPEPQEPHPVLRRPLPAWARPRSVNRRARHAHNSCG